MAAETAQNWLKKAKTGKSIEYVLCLAEGDKNEFEYRRLFAELPVRKIFNPVANMVEQMNMAAAASRGNLIVGSTDDFDCPLHWDDLLLTALKGRKNFIVKTQDGIQPFIITLPILDREYYNFLGCIYNPAYKHMYADEELAEVGKILGRTITLDIMFPHNHYSAGKMKKDEVNELNDSFYAEDRATFRRRKANNFDL